MSKGAHNSAHRYQGIRVGRAARLASKLGRCLDLGRLERLLRDAQKIVARARERQR
jgi:hypothetical protein